MTNHRSYIHKGNLVGQKKKRTSRQTVTAKPSEVKLIRDEEQHVTQNTDKWRGPVVALCPTGDEEIQVR